MIDESKQVPTENSQAVFHVISSHSEVNPFSNTWSDETVREYNIEYKRKTWVSGAFKIMKEVGKVYNKSIENKETKIYKSWQEYSDATGGKGFLLEYR
jgi:hypothetical protein